MYTFSKHKHVYTITKHCQQVVSRCLCPRYRLVIEGGTKSTSSYNGLPDIVYASTVFPFAVCPVAPSHYAIGFFELESCLVCFQRITAAPSDLCQPSSREWPELILDLTIK